MDWQELGTTVNAVVLPLHEKEERKTWLVMVLAPRLKDVIRNVVVDKTTKEHCGGIL